MKLLALASLVLGLFCSGAEAGRSVTVGTVVAGLPWDLSALDAHEAKVGKHQGIVNFFWSWDDANYRPDMSLFTAIDARGTTPMITWMPQDYRDGAVQPRFALSTIIAGDHDVFIRGWAEEMAAYGKPILMRFAHEMNGDWYPWSNGTPREYITAWQHVHDIFSAASNVSWVWSPNVGMADPGLYFPGDAYVDYVGLDGYNSSAWGWQSFDSIFYSTYQRVTSLSTKPVIIAEFASNEGSSLQKANWIRDAYRQIRSSRYSRVVAAIWFDIDKTADEGAGRDWRVDSSSSSLSAYRWAIRGLSSQWP